AARLRRESLVRGVEVAVEEVVRLHDVGVGVDDAVAVQHQTRASPCTTVTGWPSSSSVSSAAIRSGSVLAAHARAPSGVRTARSARSAAPSRACETVYVSIVPGPSWSAATTQPAAPSSDGRTRRKPPGRGARPYKPIECVVAYQPTPTVAA